MQQVIILPPETDGWVINDQFYGWSSADLPISSTVRNYKIIKTQQTAKLDVVIASKVLEWMKFQDLLKAWRSERSTASWVMDMATCPAYQAIIGIGPPAIPLILAQLKSEGDEPDHWFWALRALTGADPVTEADRGDIVKMATAWIEWGHLQGYVW